MISPRWGSYSLMKRLVRNLTVSAVTHDTVGMRYGAKRQHTTQHDIRQYSYTHGVHSQLIPHSGEINNEPKREVSV